MHALSALVALVCSFYSGSQAFAQCGCTHIVSLSASEWMFDGAVKNVKPGDKICFASGNRKPIVFYNINGTAAKPVTITNMCDGKVTLEGAAANPYVIEVHKSSYFRFTGTGNSNEQYGIELKGCVMGIDVKELSTDFEVDHLKITNLAYAGIVAKTDPTCDPSTWRGNYTMRNTSFHDNYISDILGEGFYIGNSHYHTTVAKTCSGSTIQVKEHEVIGVKVFNNIMRNIGHDAIQIGGATSDCSIHHNTIYNVGTTNEYGQQSGIQINPGTDAECYNNIIDTGTGYGIFAGGRGGSRIYNNVISNHLQGGIIAQDYPPVNTKGFVFANNTLINNTDYGIYMFSENTTQNLFVNNIVIATNQSTYMYVRLNNPSKIKWTAANNIQTKTIGDVKFINPSSKDYHLQATSPALDAGQDVTGYNITFDLDDKLRPVNSKFDIGAYEIQSNKPTANAGPDKTITLPTSSVTLNGSGTSTTGITGYLWTKKSGGAADLVNATTANLTAENLEAGTYVFQLQVKDAAGTATDEVTVIVLPAAVNKNPIANAGPDKTITLPVNSVNLNGSATDDGTITGYAWTQTSGPTATLTGQNSSTLQLTNLVEGTYQFLLTVTDNQSATGSDAVTVVVNPAAINQPPVVNAGADVTIYLPINQVILTGKATDSDGTIASVVWEKRSGGTANLTNANTLALTATNLTQGAYVFRLTVKDNGGATTFDEVNVLVLQANQSPTANAGPDKTIVLPTNTVILSGSGTDADDGIASYQWKTVSGGAATLTDATTPTLTVKGLVQGTYVFGLTVTDKSGATGYDEVTVVVDIAPVNAPPVVNAGPDATITLPTNSITLTGTATDADDVASVLWSLKSGPTATLSGTTTLTLSATDMVAGIYTFTLQAFDTPGAQASDDVVVTVLPNSVNQPPIVNAGTNKYLTLPDNTIILTGTASDPDGSIASVAWSQVSGATPGISGENTTDLSLSGLTEGIYQFRFTATDNKGAIASSDVTLTVTATNIAPLVNAGEDQTIILPQNSITLTATASDLDGTVSTYDWTQLSGPMGATLTNTTTPSLTAGDLIAGTYEFLLSVTDNDAATSSDKVVITVIEATTNQLPIVSAGPDETIYLPTNSVVLTGIARDPDGTIASLLWTQTSGSATTSNETTNTLTVVNMTEGTYVFRLTATDDSGGMAYDEVEVVVMPAASNQRPLANAGGNRVIQLPTNTVTLNGSGSDSDGTVASYAWEKLTGAAATIVSNSTAQTLITGLAEGLYTFQLTVTDNAGATATSRVTVTVLPTSVNQNPLASAGLNQSIILPTTTTNLVGSASDPDGTIQSTLWSKLSGPAGGTISSPNTLITSLNDLVEGSYTFRLTVTDNMGATGVDDVTIIVSSSSANQFPIASAGGNRIITLPTNTLNLPGSGFDPDGTIVKYAWTKVSGGLVVLVNADQPTLTLTNLIAGQYAFRLIVTDNAGATNEDICFVTVNPQNVNTSPTAFAGGDRIIRLPPNSTTINGSGSDIDGQIIEYAWSQTAGPAAGLANASTPTLTVTGLIENIYRLRLTVTDNSQSSGFDEMVLRVIPSGSNMPPVVDAGNDVTIYLPQNTVSVTPIATDDGVIQKFIWTKMAGPAATITSPESQDLTVTGLTEGSYVFQVVVIDDNGASSADLVTVTVMPPGTNQPPVVDAGPDQIVTLPDTDVVLLGTAADAEGPVSNVQWTLVSGGPHTPGPDNALQFTVTGLEVGTYVFRLTATDNQGATSSDDVQVIVNPVPPNQPPLVDAGINTVLTLPTNDITLTGTATDTDGTVTTTMWSQVTGPNVATISNPASLTLNATNLIAGTYVFRLTATDNENAKGFNDVIVFVAPDLPDTKTPPVAYAGTDMSITFPQNTVRVEGDGLDPDGYLVSYQWDFVSGPTATITKNNYILELSDMAVGEYVFRLTVTDNDTLTASDDLRISVIEQTNEIPKFFSPNNDNYGEYWQFRNLDAYQACRIVIFSRAGKEVFAAKPYQNDWNGTQNGRPLNAGDYYYVLNCDDGRVLKGAVRIIR